MTAFKGVATLILVMILVLAWLTGPLGDSERTVPGLQSPGEPIVAGDGPTPVMAFIAFMAAVVLGLKARQQAF